LSFQQPRMGLPTLKTPWLRIRLPEECGNFWIHRKKEQSGAKDFCGNR
jgi:hypothetical protein